MSAREQWLATNDDFLSARLDWLRGRLQALADSTPRVPGAGGVDIGAAVGSAADPARTEPGPPAPEPDLPLARLAASFGLTGFETDIVFLCAAMELDTGMGALCAAAQHDAGRDHPTFALAMQLFDGPAWDAMSPDGPLRHWPLVQVLPGPGQPLLTARLTLDERLVNYLKGLDHVDGRLRPLLEQLPPSPGVLSLSQGQAARDVAAMAATAAASHVVLLLGPHLGSKRLIAAQAADLEGKRLFAIEAVDIAAAPGGARAAALLWHRETMLSDVALYVDSATTEAASTDGEAVRHWLSHSGGIIFLDVRDRWPGLRAPAIDIANPTPAEQRLAWAAVASTSGAARLAGQFDFELDAIHAAVAGLPQASSPVPDVDARLWTAALALARPALDQLVQRVESTATFADLQLPAPEQALLHEIAGQVTGRAAVYGDYGFAARMSRGLGISVMFAGESGTGKTLAAEALAGELGLSLYRIDLSAVVSKYIGETEKNLRQLFDAAENGGAVLFFDEADALFGKRSEIKDSHDRYANIEVSYLLQRMEQFRGLAVLATNRKDSLDQAFLRRLRFVVNFPFPALPERRAIWAGAFPAAAPVDGVDFDRLARLNLTGGSITNVALNAAFLGAADGGGVTMELILAAARSEYRKLDKPLNESDFHWQPAGADAGVGHGH